MDEMDEVVQEFLTESAENLDRLDQEFVALEKDPSRVDLIAAIFRTIHTIKGTCGFLGFGKLERVAHAGETLLARLRDGMFAFDRPCADALLATVDAVRTILGHVQRTGQDGTDDHAFLVARLLALAEGQREVSDGSDEAEPDTEQVPAEPPAVDEAPALENRAATPQVAEPALQSATNNPAVADHSVRVDVALLEKLMNLVGELVLARNQLQRHTGSAQDSGLHQIHQRVNLITSELQEGMMKTRMQPVGTAWSKLPRLCRDVAATCRKRVRLELEGEDTEVDRTLIDAIRDPLTHIVRNAVDHGIESPSVRSAAGKPPEGVILLRAWHEGGQVHLEVSDDGGGLNLERILRKARERGLVTAEESARLTPREVTDLIFEPGFSTAESVTAVSGRGVGMDVVRTDIAAVNGTVDVTSREGQGTTLRIRIPLTLAIIPALIVTCATETFAVPQVSVLQLVRIDATRTDLTEVVHDARLFRHQGELIPLLLLDEELGLRAEGRAAGVGVLVLQAGDRRFGVAVDQIGDCAEVVVKPLNRSLKALGIYAGATIAGDGRVALILDVAGLARRAHLTVEGAAVSGHAKVVDDTASLRSYLVVQTVDDGRAALPLEGVSRLEEIGAFEIQRIGDTEVVRCRGRILPLVRLSDALHERRVCPRRTQSLAPGTPPRLPVVVHEGPDGAVGFIAEQILEIVDVHITEHRPPVRPGVLFSATINDRVTEILDIPWIAALAVKPPEIVHG